jgi:glutamyl-tRNA synthetase
MIDPVALHAGGRTRLAPTPSGYLHRGNAFNFLVTHRIARATASKLLLRIDDLDTARTRPAYIEDIFHSLEWLGIEPDEGPSGPGELVSRWSQGSRVPRYLEACAALRGAGHLYACTCSRAELRRLEAAGAPHCPCRDAGRAYEVAGTTWRLALPAHGTVVLQEASGGQRTLRPADLMGDPVLRQRDGRPAYHVASLLDDVDQGITFIVRGDDLLPSTVVQLHMAGLLGLDRFKDVRFLHHPILRDADGAKLSKSAGASSLKAMREAGQGPGELIRAAEEWLAERFAGPVQ